MQRTSSTPQACLGEVEREGIIIHAAGVRGFFIILGGS